MLSSNKLFNLHRWALFFLVIFLGLMGISAVLRNIPAFILSILFSSYSAFLLRITLQEIRERLI